MVSLHSEHLHFAGSKHSTRSIQCLPASAYSPREFGYRMPSGTLENELRRQSTDVGEPNSSTSSSSMSPRTSAKLDFRAIDRRSSLYTGSDSDESSVVTLADLCSADSSASSIESFMFPPDIQDHKSELLTYRMFPHKAVSTYFLHNFLKETASLLRLSVWEGRSAVATIFQVLLLLEAKAYFWCFWASCSDDIPCYMLIASLGTFCQPSLWVEWELADDSMAGVDICLLRRTPWATKASLRCIGANFVIQTSSQVLHARFMTKISSISVVQINCRDPYHPLPVGLSPEQNCQHTRLLTFLLPKHA